LLLAALAWLILAFGVQPAPPEPGFAPLTVTATPIPEFLRGSPDTRFGALVYLGGIELHSSEDNFGSLSGLDFLPDGRTLIAIADTGFWFRATLAETEGRPTGLADAMLGPILDADGRVPTRKALSDAEALRLTLRDGTPTALVTFEVRTALRAFAGPDFALALPQPVSLPSFVTGVRRNQGLEAVAVAPADSGLAGAVVAIAERSLDGGGNHRGFILSGPEAGAFAIRRSKDFDVTDAAFLPSGDLLVLERRFALPGGFAMRLRQFDATSVRTGAILDGRILIEADDDHFAVDNMEGLAVRPSPDGGAILTLVSDDNGSFLQRTLLLQFALPPIASPMPNLKPQ
jgi:hypothetical protein